MSCLSFKSYRIMEDYKAILHKSEQELAALKQREAVVTSKVDALVEELGLDKTQPLEPQILALKTELTSKIEASAKKVEELLKQLEELNNE